MERKGGSMNRWAADFKGWRRGRGATTHSGGFAKTALVNLFKMVSLLNT